MKYKIFITFVYMKQKQIPKCNNSFANAFPVGAKTSNAIISEV